MTESLSNIVPESFSDRVSESDIEPDSDRELEKHIV